MAIRRNNLSKGIWYPSIPRSLALGEKSLAFPPKLFNCSIMKSKNQSSKPKKTKPYYLPEVQDIPLYEISPISKPQSTHFHCLCCGSAQSKMVGFKCFPVYTNLDDVIHVLGRNVLRTPLPTYWKRITSLFITLYDDVWTFSFHGVPKHLLTWVDPGLTSIWIGYGRFDPAIAWLVVWNTIFGHVMFQSTFLWARGRAGLGKVAGSERASYLLGSSGRWQWMYLCRMRVLLA